MGCCQLGFCLGNQRMSFHFATTAICVFVCWRQNPTEVCSHPPPSCSTRDNQKLMARHERKGVLDHSHTGAQVTMSNPIKALGHRAANRLLDLFLFGLFVRSFVRSAHDSPEPSVSILEISSRKSTTSFRLSESASSQLLASSSRISVRIR